MNLRYKPAKLAAVLIALCLGFNTVAAEQSWTVNFNDTDIQQVIKFMADATGKTIIIDPKVRGPVKVISAKPLNSEELYDLFLSVLDVHGYTAIESGSVVRIVPNRDARSLPVPNESNVTEVDDTYITQVIQLKNISAAKVLPTLRPLVPQYGHISAYDSSNALIITDTRANIIRLNELIAKIDQSAVIGTELIELRYAQAADIVNIITTLEKPDPNRGTTTSPVVLVADKRINGVIISGDDLQRQRVKMLIDQMDRPQTKNSNMRVVYLKYAKAEEVSKVLTGMVQNLAQAKPVEGQAPGGTAGIQFDADTNAVLITADSDVMESLLTVVDSLDIRRAQVLVEAIIVEISENNGKELGIEWMYRDSEYGFGSSGRGDRGILGGVAGAAFEGGDSGLANLASGLSGIAGQAFGIGRLGTRTDFAALIKILQENNKTNILSTPNLLTTDNHEASISVGQEVPFETGSYTSTGGTTNPSSPFTTIERKDVGVMLTVTPHVNDGDSVVLDISQEVSSIEDTTTRGIITNKRTIETQILAENGQIVVLGGLIRDEIRTTDLKVPILGSIPVIGNAFRSQTSDVVKTNLLVFIRATVVEDGKMMTGATAEKYSAIRDIQLEQRRKAGMLVNSREVPILPEWVDVATLPKPESEESLPTEVIDLRSNSIDPPPAEE
ncbi:type II secretion system secretin GspD [Cellvibrio sp. ARAG 10.3]|uniref:type II secretion system secretin GspD n=1 Tax=Cellvibrio sp. ARAG 10.3 TaxID=3451358 RepID=UPI003F47246F